MIKYLERKYLDPEPTGHEPYWYLMWWLTVLRVWKVWVKLMRKLRL